MRYQSELTQDYIISLFEFDPKTAIFIRKPRIGTDHRTKLWNACFAGKTAGGIHTNGYHHIYFDKFSVRAHWLVWFLTTGAWPKDQIDHIDMNRTNNVFSNLREATSSENDMNRKVQKNNKLGVKGIGYRKDLHKPYTVVIAVDRKRHRLGNYTTLEEAIMVREEAVKRLHGAFGRS